MGHCSTCDAYESAIQEARTAGQEPRSVEPCPDYVMSQSFRSWLVAAARDEVFGTSRLGLVLPEEE